MKPLLFSAFLCLLLLSATAQPSNVNLHQPFRLPDVYARMQDSVQRQFEKQKLAWPPHSMYIRSFKYDRQLEVWVQNSEEEPYRHFKTYRVCMQSGSTGPKRMEGDYQVPEGFYHVNELNANSMYHLALGLSYPNASDRILSDAARPGGNIYIHGNCVSTGCIAIMDIPVEELFIIASHVKAQGQEFIPVHVFPARYNVKKSADYLANVLKDNENYKLFNSKLKQMFDHFELKKQLPVIMVNRKGEYVLN